MKLSDFTTSVLDFTSFTRLRNFQAAFKGGFLSGWVGLGFPGDEVDSKRKKSKHRFETQGRILSYLLI